MTGHQLNGGWVIWCSLLVALLLSIAPLPQSVMSIRPLWCTLFFIYWALTLPHRVSLVAAWIIGIILDVLADTLLGQNALILVLIVYTTLLFQPKIYPQPAINQCLFIAILLTVAQLLQLWIDILSGAHPSYLTFIFPVITSVIIWPWVASSLKLIKVKLNVN